MTTMLANVYLALKAANVSDELAQKAAEEVAEYDDQIAEIRGELKLLRWMAASNLAIVIALAIKAFFP